MGKLTEVASFDTYPQDDDSKHRSAWTAYPFFESGVVIVSAMGEGLFVLQPNLLPELAFANQDNTVAVCSANTATVSITLNAHCRYEDTVELTANDLPADVTGVLTPTTLAMTNSSVAVTNLSLALGELPLGRHSFTLQISDSAVEESQKHHASPRRPIARATPRCKRQPIARKLRHLHRICHGQQLNKP